MAGPGELGNLLKQAQKMQREMDLARQEILDTTVEGTAGGNAARVEVDGNGTVKAIHISEDALESGDKSALEDLVLAAPLLGRCYNFPHSIAWCEKQEGRPFL